MQLRTYFVRGIRANIEINHVVDVDGLPVGSCVVGSLGADGLAAMQYYQPRRRNQTIFPP